jgi:predicted dehydrogenase
MADGRGLTRRGFLRRAAGAGAAVAAPAVIRASAFGANDRITTGIIGLGGPAGSGAGGTELLAVCDVRDDKLARYAGRRGIASTRDFRELLARPDIDAVLIGTPDHWHAIPAIEACKAGKDVYCEKPLSLTIREARAMVTAARRTGRVFQTGSQQRAECGGRFRFACEMVRSGRIGDLECIHVSVGGPSGPCDLPPQPTPAGVDWDMWLGPAPWRPFHPAILGGWRAFRDYSGGGMTDWGAHHFDIAQWALGMDASGPVEIVPPDGRGVKWLTYVYANGIEVYHGGGPGGAGVVFHGTRGRIGVDRGTLWTDPPHLLNTPTLPDEVRLYRADSNKGNWLACIRTRRRPICDVEIGCRSVTVCHLGNIAYWLKRPLRWDPVREEFPGDPEANRWLDRAKRPPWHI